MRLVVWVGSGLLQPSPNGQSPGCRWADDPNQVWLPAGPPGLTQALLWAYPGKQLSERLGWWFSLLPPILLRVPPVSPGVNFSPLVAALLILLPKTVQLGPGEARWTGRQGLGVVWEVPLQKVWVGRNHSTLVAYTYLPV